MKLFLNVLAILLTLTGVIWFLQGINILPGSFMTGQIKWTIYGCIAFLAGIGLLVSVNRRRNSPPKE